MREAAEASGGRNLANLVSRDILNGRPASSAPALFLLANGFDAAALRKAADIYRESDPTLSGVLAEEADHRPPTLARTTLGAAVEAIARSEADRRETVLGASSAIVIQGGYSVGLGPHGTLVLTVGRTKLQLVPDDAAALGSDLMGMAMQAAGRSRPAVVAVPLLDPLVPAAFAAAFSTYLAQVRAEVGDALTRSPSPDAIFNEWTAGTTPGAAAVKLLAQGSLKGRR